MNFENQPEGIEKLKEILFEEERKQYEDLHEKVKNVQLKMDESLHAKELPVAVFNSLIEQMMMVMPERLGPTITQTLKVQIKESRDDVVQALFPIIGEMIKKYVQQEIHVLTEKIDEQMEYAFSLDMWILKLKSLFTGVSVGELMLEKTNGALIQEIFIIEEGSGILKASYSHTGIVDKDMIAGMLTAIKSFVEDAFEREQKQSLEMVSYDSFNIYVQSFNKFYIAVVLTGAISAAFKSKLNDAILSFVKEVMLKTEHGSEIKELAEKLKLYFEKI